jgi:hypothetical protein
MLQGRIFISYRRDDSAGYARLIYDRLNARFPNRVFMDVTGIKAGADFVEVVEQAVGSCVALVALIGQQWLATEGRRRLEDPADFVRLEIAAALKRNIRVIPVLLRGAAMPSIEELPPDLASLTRRQAIELSDANFDHDIERLIRSLELEPAMTDPRRTASPARRYWLIAAGAVLIAAVIGLSVWRGKQGVGPPENTRTEQSPSPQTAPANDIESSIDGLGGALQGMIKSLPGTAAGPQTQSAPGAATRQFAFDPVGRWLIATRGAASASMLVNLKAGGAYEILNASGAFSEIGRSGTWSFNQEDKRFVLLPTGSMFGYGMQITEKHGDSFHASDLTYPGVTHVFKRQ